MKRPVDRAAIVLACAYVRHRNAVLEAIRKWALGCGRPLEKTPRSIATAEALELAEDSFREALTAYGRRRRRRSRAKTGTTSRRRAQGDRP